MAFPATSFIYGGISSEDYGLYLGSTSNPGFEKTQASTNPIFIIDSIKSRTHNFIYGIEQSEPNLKFTLDMFTYDYLSRSDIAYIDNAFFSSTMPKKLVFCQEDMANYYYNAIFSKNQIISSGNQVMGFSCDIICADAYAYEPFKTAIYDVVNGDLNKVRFNNLSGGLNYLYPRINFVCNRDSGKLKIINKSDNNRTFEIWGLKNGETVSIDEWFHITSSTGLMRLENCNKQWLRFAKGINHLEIQGDTSRVNVTYQFNRSIGS